MAERLAPVFVRVALFLLSFDDDNLDLPPIDENENGLMENDDSEDDEPGQPLDLDNEHGHDDDDLEDDEPGLPLDIDNEQGPDNDDPEDAEADFNPDGAQGAALDRADGRVPARGRAGEPALQPDAPVMRRAVRRADPGLDARNIIPRRLRNLPGRLD